MNLVIPYTFVAGTKAKAEEINAVFNAIKVLFVSAVSSNDLTTALNSYRRFIPDYFNASNVSVTANEPTTITFDGILNTQESATVVFTSGESTKTVYGNQIIIPKNTEFTSNKAGTIYKFLN